MAVKSNKKTVRPSAPALLQKVTVLSKKDKNTVSLLQGTVRVLYWESILSDTVSASVVFSDAGNTMNKTTAPGQGNKGRKKKVSAVEGLPITGGEQVDLKFTDNNGNTVNFGKGGNNLFINNRKDIVLSHKHQAKHMS